MDTPATNLVTATRAARALIERLRLRHGPLLLHQAAAAGRQDLPQCFVWGHFPLAERDVLLGVIDGTPFYVSRPCRVRPGQAPALAPVPVPVMLDAMPGRAGVLSLERPTGLRFAALWPAGSPF